ncbi:MAG: hypothetical protein M2R45_04770 [Verrucomicrobia subdivision 3 bacterium]|nr:hypothetical protein [Limisphaerales bacterium]MCS1415100.1 hypothetical protein [Limisphaerales bacterium]
MLASRFLDASPGMYSDKPQLTSPHIGKMFLSAFFAMLCIWSGSVFTVFWSVNNANQTTDFVQAAGITNTVFSGLAFEGLLVTVILQSVEFSHQHLKLRNGRLDQRKNAKMLGCILRFSRAKPTLMIF